MSTPLFEGHRLTRLVRDVGGDVLARQLVFAGLYAVSVAIALLPAVSVDAPTYLLLGLLVEVGVLTAAAVLPWDRWPQRAQDLLPAASVVAVLLLGRGTSDQVVTFTTLVLVPVVMFAMSGDWSGILFATVASVVAVTVPHLWIVEESEAERSLALGLFFPVVSFALACFVAGTADARRTDAVRLEEMAADWRRSRDRLTALFSAATEVAIIGTDADGRVEVFNRGAESQSGLAADEVVGRSILELGLTEEIDAAAAEAGVDTGGADPDRARWYGVLGAARTGGKRELDLTLVRRGVPAGTVHVTITRRERLPGQAAPGYLVVARDVTAERETERAKDQFVGYVSHELRTPISSVLGYLELLELDGEGLTATQRGYLDVIERNARRLLRLVEDLLLTAQMDAGRFAVSHEPTDLSVVAAGSVRAARPHAEAAGVTVLDSSEASVPLEGDPVRLGQMVDNLVSNALKFTPAGGTVTVSARHDDGDTAVVSVQDTGAGIAPDDLRHLTERFFRSSDAMQQRIPGVGLGLSITQAIAEAHGGRLTIESHVGRGSTFTVRLPTVLPGQHRHPPGTQ